MTAASTISQSNEQSGSVDTHNFITVHADGKSDVDVRITEVGGDLVFDVSVVNGSNPNLSSLQALYFNIKGLDLNEASSLKIEGTGISRSGVIADKAGLDDSNVNGHGGPYDVFVEFGSNGVYSAKFTLSDHDSNQPLLLSLVGGQAFGFRLDTPDDKITTISSQAPNHLPVAANDTLQTSEDTPLIVPATSLLANDKDLDGGILLVSKVTQGANGTVSLANGQITYKPNKDFFGTDTFTYTVTDSQGGQSTATVTVTVSSVNDAPVAKPVALPDGKQGETFIITAAQLLAGASDVDDDKLTISSLSLESGSGTLIANGDGTWTYAPDPQQSGPVSFRYTVSDGKEAASSTASLILAPTSGTTSPGNDGSVLAGAYDDLIEGGDGDDTIHGGRGNDEMQGEGGNDTIVGGTDNGRLGWEGNTLTKVTIGDNLYGNDGADTYFYEKGDGVDLIWDFRPNEDTIVLGYSSTEIIGATYVRGVTNSIKTPSHDKIALILGRGATTHDAIVINDFGGLKDSERKAFIFADGKTLSMKDIIALTGSKPVETQLPETWSGVPASGSRNSGRTSNSLDLFGSNDAEALIGRAGDDRLYGNEGFNQLNGNDGFDELYGGNVEDVLIGGKDDDLGYGNGGADTIVGGVGSDKLYGAGGADIIYGDTDGAADGKDISYPGFDLRFNLGLESKYRALFEPADPVDGVSVSAGPLVITSGKNWWGGFEVTVTVKADASLAGWNLFLNSAYEITSVWGAELSKVQGGSTSALYELKNAPWNGSLAKGQTTTIGFTVRTPFNLVVDDKSLLLKGLKIGTEATVDAEVAGAVGMINEKLSSMKEVTASESYTLSGTNQKLVAVSGTKAMDLAGNMLGNIIIGNDGSNEIAGRAGKDVLTGNKGKDTFVFDTALSKANLDTITDFSVKDDKFFLDKTVFKKLGAGKPTNPKQLNKNFFSLDKAKDKNDYVIYNEKTGVLSYDADGSGKGKAIEFAKIKAGLELKLSHFYVI